MLVWPSDPYEVLPLQGLLREYERRMLMGVRACGI